MTTDAPRCDNCDKPIADLRRSLDTALGLLSGWLFRKAGRYVPGITNDTIEFLRARGIEIDNIDPTLRPAVEEARAVTPETVIALTKAWADLSDDDVAVVIARHADPHDKETDRALRACGMNVIEYDGPGADAIKRDLARLVMERAGIGK